MERPTPARQRAKCKNRLIVCLGRRPLGRANAFHLHRVFFTETNKERGARPPVYLEASAASSSTATPPLLPSPVMAWLENLKFRHSENNKTRTLSCTGFKIHILRACEKPRKGNDLNYTPIAGKNNRPSEVSDGICIPYCIKPPTGCGFRAASGGFLPRVPHRRVHLGLRGRLRRL